MTSNILADKIIEGWRFESADELLAAVEQLPRKELYEACHRITRSLIGNGFDTCSIINVKSGRCPEDCKWCAQSAHNRTNCDEYGILPPERVREQALHNQGQGIKRFSLVASGRRPSPKEVDKYVEILEGIKKEGEKLELCASLGLASEEALIRLRDAGCTTYHCNIESAPSYFPHLCSTHTQAEKEETLRAARKVGLRLCSGGIVGMGESRQQRAEMAMYIHSLGIESIPINILHPISGTPLEHQEPMEGDEVLLTIALFRLANPTAFLRFSGGRALLTPEVQRKALYIGINAAITGDLLTTKASVTEQDMALFEEMEYDTKKVTDWK
ncbi:MAG: biotin synthase BioB [Porphyromonas sp.]|nr:biotin synthase BioB [Porphyromonas sp.]